MADDPSDPAKNKRMRARTSDDRPDGFLEGENWHYETGDPVTNADEAWQGLWLVENNDDQPPSVSQSPPHEPAPHGSINDLKAWVQDEIIDLRKKMLEIVHSRDCGTGRPGRSIYGDLWVEGKVQTVEGITGPSEINGTNDIQFTIDADATADLIKRLIFKRGGTSPDAIVEWDPTQQKFIFNFPIDAPNIGGAGIDYARFEKWECSHEDGVDPFTIYENDQRGHVYDIRIEPSAPSYQCRLRTQHRIGPNFHSLLNSDDFEIYILRSPSSGMKCSITVRDHLSNVIGAISTQPIEETGWSVAKKSVSCSGGSPAVGEIITSEIIFSDFLSGGWIKSTIPTFKYNVFG